MQDDQIGRFSETDIDTFSTLAGQIAASLQNAGLFEQVEANARRTQVRLDVSQALAAAQTEDEVLDAMIQVAGFYPQARVTIMTIDQDADELAATLCRAEAFDSGMAGQIPLGTRFTASIMPLFQHISTHTSFISPNISLDERADPQARQLVSQQGTVSFAMLPITVGEDWLGIFTISTREENFFDERKLHLYQTLAEQGAPALQAARLRAQVQENVARFRTLFDFAPEGVMVIDVDKLAFDDVNARAAELFGYTRKELLKISPLDVSAEIQPDGRTAMEVMGQAIQGAMAGDTPRLQALYVRSTGEEFSVDVQVVKLPQADRNLVRVSFSDITERVQADQAIRAERDRAQLYLDMAGSIIVALDTQGDITLINVKGNQVLGYEEGELAGQNWFDVTVPDEIRDVVKGVFAQMMAGEIEATEYYENEILTKSGEMRMVAWHNSLLRDQAGEIIGALSSGEDITEP
jgi:PAS domain S-box-containing protein